MHGNTTRRWPSSLRQTRSSTRCRRSVLEGKCIILLLMIFFEVIRHLDVYEIDGRHIFFTIQPIVICIILSQLNESCFLASLPLQGHREYHLTGMGIKNPKFSPKKNNERNADCVKRRNHVLRSPLLGLRCLLISR